MGKPSTILPGSRTFICLLTYAPAALILAQHRQQHPMKRSTQLVVVTTPDWNSVVGRLQRYERGAAAESWKPVGDAVTIDVGRNGMAWGRGLISTEGVREPQDPVKVEGDGRSPAGVFRIGPTFGYAAHAPAEWKMPYLSITAGVECVDDSASKFYNDVLDRSTTPAADWQSSEKMALAGEAYRWGAVIDQNMDPVVPRGGSCVFLHIWGGQGVGTAGCTAMPQEQLEPILSWLDPKKYPLLVEMPEAEYAKVRRDWGLPEPGP
jgi:L,D-peptidoglycan transpeptidase YkuD (ErfK/YbiS/YcfS/YnhG family)